MSESKQCYPYFDNDLYYGNWVELTNVRNINEDDISDALECVKNDVNKYIPFEYQKCVKIIRKEMSVLELHPWECPTIGWKYVPENPFLNQIGNNKRRYLDVTRKNGKEIVVTTYPEKYDDEVLNNEHFGWGNVPKNIKTFK